MFTSLIVATATAARPPGVAALAARSGLPVETLTVSEEGDVAGAIVDHVRGRQGALLMMTTGGAFLLSRSRRSVTSDVLERLRQPVLLVGPRCVQPARLDAATLLVAVEPNRPAPPALNVVGSWLETFTHSRVRLVDVVANASWPSGATDDAVRERGDMIAGAYPWIPADATVLTTNDPVAALQTFAESVDDAIFVLTSERWAGRSHWYSTTRRVVQQSPWPVLVVPADLDAV